jgi:ssDNA-binding Zn-finger/Zn-ribbon topoisomerase 1
MATLQAGCPACGAQVTFRSGSSVVVVCEYCNSVVARTDRALEDLGKVSDVVDSGSPLDVGMRGVFEGMAFELTGRAQLGHAAGGVWDEWYAAFADGRWGWLAEAQGRFYLTFRTDLPGQSLVPPYESLEVGASVPSIPAPVPFVVTEKGEALMVAAEGEIPYRLVPNEIYRYADLAGLNRAFATIDYGEQAPLVFTGREVGLAELGIVDMTHKRERAPRVVAAAQLSCPNCGGPLELRAPDIAERVTCPNCGSLLDINKGNLRFLKALEPVGFPPDIPLGAEGEFADGQRYTVIGFMTRSVEFEGVKYFWQEYLLYNPAVGFRWLVQSDAHWSFVEPVSPGDVQVSEKTVKYKGKTFRIFQDAAARVEHVAGEFYWKVEVGETVRAVDYVSPPQMLSCEVSGVVGRGKKQQGAQPQQESQEVNWSLGTYLPLRDVERIFQLKNLPRPTTVAPNQPFPHRGIYKYWALFMLAAILLGGLLSLQRPAKVFEQTFTVQTAPAAAAATPNVIRLPGGRTVTLPVPAATPAATGGEGSQVIFTEPFEIKGNRNLRVTARANVDNNWIFIEGDLINEATGLVQAFDIPVEYYHGTDGGESWTEGGSEENVYISALPAGTYTMRLEVQWEKWNQATPPMVIVRVEQNVARGLNFLLLVIALSLVPLYVVVKKISFESRRWADSEFNAAGTKS